MPWAASWRGGRPPPPPPAGDAYARSRGPRCRFEERAGDGSRLACCARCPAWGALRGACEVAPGLGGRLGQAKSSPLQRRGRPRR
eukprot:7634851-Pyramimonas_sp.AAC.1